MFGPFLLPDDVVEAPDGVADSHEEILRHSKYLRYLTRTTLEDRKFTVDFGETQEVLNFWQSHLSSPDPATTEDHHAHHACGAVIMFPSSVGSISELGLFAREKNIAEKSLTIVHSKYQNDTSFFRTGLLEVFKQENGSVEFADYANHEACVAAALKFVQGKYNSAVRRIRTYKDTDTKSRGTFLEKFLETRPN